MLDDYFQNVAIKVHYSTKPETWFAYGMEVGAEGFDAVGPATPSARVSEWQQAGDSLLWQIIISPERELHFEKLTCYLLIKMEKDLSRKFEWVAAIHKDTGHHHVHLAIRGIDKAGEEVTFSPDYVKRGLRRRAREIATAQLGHVLNCPYITLRIPPGN